jgi:pyruvate carboxylase subunit B
MHLVVSSRGRQEKVLLRREGEVTIVTVGETSYRVDVVASSATGLRSLLIDGRQFELASRRERDGRFRVSGPTVSELVEVEDPLTFLARQSSAGKGRQRSQQVTAYMPGKVVSVLAAEGDQVVAGQGLVVLEAMKMQNEIQASSDGVLVKVHVRPGQAVEGGDPLFEVR